MGTSVVGARRQVSQRLGLRASSVVLAAGLAVTGVVLGGESDLDPAAAAAVGASAAPLVVPVVPQPRSAAPVSSAASVGASGPVATAAGHRRVRRLWGRGHGRFRTRGRYGAATTRGSVDPRPLSRIRAAQEACDVWAAQVAAGMQRPRPNAMCYLDVWVDGHWMITNELPAWATSGGRAGSNAGGGRGAQGSGSPTGGSSGTTPIVDGTETTVPRGEDTTPRDGQPSTSENGPGGTAPSTGGEAGSGDTGNQDGQEEPHPDWSHTPDPNAGDCWVRQDDGTIFYPGCER